jgi:RNA polymerase sigma factor (sigma-70 family)
MARQMKTRFPGAREEFESAAYLALVEAAQSFDSSRNVNFATYARHRIRGALYDVYREWLGTTSTRPRAQTRLERPLSEGWESRGRVIGAEPDLPVGTDLEVLDTVENWIRRLPRVHALAFRHIYLDGKTQNEAAHLVGCSKWKLCRMHSQAITWLQQASEHELCS